jgi:hypothetical protein
MIHAYGMTEDGKKTPAIVLTQYTGGKVLYINLPLGQLKANADDLPLRSVLQTFLFDIVGIPHIMNVADGRGVIVINWHIDSAIEHITLPEMYQDGFLRKELPASFHITAGDFLDDVGDGEGFDAAGKGRELTEMVKEFGAVGSHGGWAHNWFAKNIEDGVFTEQEIREFIVKNNACLEELTGKKVLEYSAPNGVHPQPVVTKILEDLGVIAYYYTGDVGSAPNRTFYDGKMITDKVIAFPVMPLEKYASLWEMRALGHKSESEVAAWYTNILDYAAHHRVVRMVYSHPYNIAEYPEEVKDFLDKAAEMKADNEIAVQPMSEYAKFFLRFLKTNYNFNLEEHNLKISLKNPDGLHGVCTALPKGRYEKPLADGIEVTEDDKYYYITVVSEDEKEKSISVAIK